MRRIARLIGVDRVARLGALGRRLPVVSATLEAIDNRRSRRLEAAGGAAERAKSRWRASAPEPGLTWGVELSGEAIVEKAGEYGAFEPGRTVLEIGPGYGRILRSCLERDVGFERYLALDISEANVRHLRARFSDPRIDVIHGDAESVSLGTSVDTVISSLTFKHLYPSFEPALANLSPQLSERAVVLFDLIEGDRRYFQWDQTTFIREYGRDEVDAILARVGLERIAFDLVEHDRDHVRLLVVARPRVGRSERSDH